MKHFFKLAISGALICALAGCRQDTKVNQRTSGFEDFIPRYNTYIKNWLEEQSAATEKAIAETSETLETAAEEERETLERNLENLQREKEKWDFRLSRGDYFRYSDPSEIPADLAWEDGMEHEEIGDPNAKKGGTFNSYIPTFPPTLRPFGDNSNNGFRGTLYDDIDLDLVRLHPKTGAIIPGLAEQWAVSEDGRTVFFKIHKKARYSDGTPVKADHFIFTSYIRISDDIVNPYQKQYWREEMAGFVVYDDHTLSISLPEAKLYAPYLTGGLSPSAPHFYDDYGPDFTEKHQWKFPPTTGAYKVLPEDIVKGVSITQTRVKDWWAKDLKYYKYRFNADRVRHVVVRDRSKAFELFRAGELDSFYITRPEFWYEKSVIEPVFKGYIERHTFYTQYPALPIGMYMNVSKPLLDEKQIRIGIQHAMNWQKVINVIYRGDYQRLNAFNEDFLLFSDPSIKARPYSITKAREAFRAAGFTSTDRNGILERPDGTKLSISVSYRVDPTYDRMFAILKEEAKACGFDLRLDPNEATVDYKKSMLKQHEITFGGWVITPPTPRFYDFMHSSNARDEKGNLKPQTNNHWVWGRDDTDVLSETVRNALTEEELRDAAVKLQNIIHEEAFFVPAYKVKFVRVGCWRWVRWPDSEETRFCAPVIYEPTEVHVHWVDEKLKAETMEAKRNGKSFDEVNRVHDEYRFIETEQTPEPIEESSNPIDPADLPKVEMEEEE
ncbi:MAG: ABC transporter substrate-binding protein [Akkermansiaceae bacterium]